MTEQTTLDRVTAVLRDVSGYDGEVTAASDLRTDLMIDSLDMVEAVMQIEEKFGLDLTDDQAEGIKTVGDIVALIDGARA